MSAERMFEPWEEVQRHGQDLADRLTEGFNGLIHTHAIKPPSFTWPPSPPKPTLFDVDFPIQSFGKIDCGSGIDGVSAILDIGNRLGQAGAEFGASVNGMVEQFFRRLPGVFGREDESRVIASLRADLRRNEAVIRSKEDGAAADAGKFKEFEFVGDEVNQQDDEEIDSLNLSLSGLGAKSQGTVNVTATYDSRTRDLENTLVARGDLWRVEASHGNSASGNGNSPLFLVQLGPVLFVRDSTLLLPVHLSKQHLLWYGYDRKNGIHSLCPAIWSKHRRYLLMSMICLNPLVPSFVDLQFPNGQLTYVSGEGLTTSAFLPLAGGLLQAQGQYPGEMKFSYSCKTKWGTSVTPMVQWPDKSFTLGVAQELAWQRSGLMVRPTVQLSVSPTFGGSNPGWQAEVIHSVKEQLSLVYGCSFATHPCAFALVSVGRSKWNGNVGKSGVVIRVDSPTSGVARPSYSIQINSGIEF
uniref:Uncharacterized protein n=1 Tax=Kalanchoe fedtschenkoi TaxID=63787 RepID=A0A7N0SY17_KALFE